jgi:hypothetical protein
MIVVKVLDATVQNLVARALYTPGPKAEMWLMSRRRGHHCGGLEFKLDSGAQHGAGDLLHLNDDAFRGGQKPPGNPLPCCWLLMQFCLCANLAL